MKKPKTDRKQSFYSKDKDEQKVIRELRTIYRKSGSELSFKEWLII